MKARDRTVNVLVADVPAAHATLAACLPGMHLTFTDSLRAARYFLHQQSFDVVVIGLHFDDSRMFDLLSFMRGSARLHSLPALCVQTRPSMLPAELRGTLAMSIKALGANAFVEISGRNRELLSDEIRAALQGSVQSPGETKQP
jgi:hypothetical protein